jgi:hypothetical protein
MKLIVKGNQGNNRSQAYFYKKSGDEFLFAG